MKALFVVFGLFLATNIVKSEPEWVRVKDETDKEIIFINVTSVKKVTIKNSTDVIRIANSIRQLKTPLETTNGKKLEFLYKTNIYNCTSHEMLVISGAFYDRENSQPVEIVGKNQFKVEKFTANYYELIEVCDLESSKIKEVETSEIKKINRNNI